jgi:hypothetical protein
MTATKARFKVVRDGIDLYEETEDKVQAFAFAEAVRTGQVGAREKGEGKGAITHKSGRGKTRRGKTGNHS